MHNTERLQDLVSKPEQNRTSERVGIDWVRMELEGEGTIGDIEKENGDFMVWMQEVWGGQLNRHITLGL